MKLAIKSNFFERGGLYFLQMPGTTMGTSAAYMLTAIYFVFKEMVSTISNYGNNLLLLLRFIDDIIRIWGGCPTGLTLDGSRKEVNNFGTLG